MKCNGAILASFEKTLLFYGFQQELIRQNYKPSTLVESEEWSLCPLILLSKTDSDKF